MALNMALGNVDIHSFKTVDNFDPISRKVKLKKFTFARHH